MCWSICIPIHQSKQNTNRTIKWDRIINRSDAVEVKFPIALSIYLSSAIWTTAVRIRHIIMTTTVRFPNIQKNMVNWLALLVFHRSTDQHGLTGFLSRYGRSILELVGWVMEGAQNRGFSGAGLFCGIDCVDQRRDTKNIRKKNKFLAIDVACLSNLLRRNRVSF